MKNSKKSQIVIIIGLAITIILSYVLFMGGKMGTSINEILYFKLYLIYYCRRYNRVLYCYVKEQNNFYYD